MIKMIITDLDQTILRDDGSISGYTKEMLEECKKRGILIGIATARLMTNAIHLQELLGAELLICSNGSRVIYKGEDLEGILIDAGTVHDLTDSLQRLESMDEILMEGKEQDLIRRFPQCRCLHYRDSVRYAFLAKEVSKKNALLRTARKLHISMSEIAGFGDDEGDIEMLSVCGIGVAMGNALESAKKVSDAVTKTNNEDGVAWFIERHILNRQ